VQGEEHQNVPNNNPSIKKINNPDPSLHAHRYRNGDQLTRDYASGSPEINCEMREENCSIQIG
jgi:hypothetical protein